MRNQSKVITKNSSQIDGHLQRLGQLHQVDHVDPTNVPQNGGLADGLLPVDRSRDSGWRTGLCQREMKVKKEKKFQKASHTINASTSPFSAASCIQNWTL